MNTRLLHLYHRLPPRTRSVAATLRGWYLKRWRYGEGSEQLVEEALARDAWSAAQWATWREERIAYVLHRAATHVPYYRNHWEARRRRGDRSSWEILANWPILEKDEVRAHSRAFVADDCDPNDLFHEQTSGTTGKPIDIWRSRTTIATLHAIADARTCRWDGIPTDARWARLGGQLVTPVRQRRPPFWVWNAAMRQLYLSSFHLAPDLIPYYLGALARYRITYLATYPSSAYALAHEILQLGRTDLQLRAVYTNAEPLLPEQRATIGKAFNCPVRETYGLCEAVAAASECSAGQLHQWPEFGHVELHEHGEIVATGLLNIDMPLIRYRAGDRAQAPKANSGAGPCRCGRSLPLLGRIEGRMNDLLVTRDGRLVFWLNPVFYGLPVRQSQIIQEHLDELRVRVSPAPGYSAITERTITGRLQERMGDVRVIVDRVMEVPRTTNGKLRAVVCNLPREQREAALRSATVTPAATV
ncbi:MAG TPA: AMP-binding protein [Gemmatimonadales bacterium]|nr:AMP-binding protein [Gemmatimonadales bacterium]